MRLGLVADIHGDLIGFQTALKIFANQETDLLVCAGDIVDRGPEADEIVRLLKALDAVCIKGNHEHSVLHQQERWRRSERQDRLRELGRIISDDTAEFIEALPETLTEIYDGVRTIIAHGVPWSDVLGLFPDTRPSRFHVLAERVGDDADLVILGHTHIPMDIRIGGLRVINPGSIYGVTIRDSHTCAILSLPDGKLQIFDLKQLQEVEISIMTIA